MDAASDRLDMRGSNPSELGGAGVAPRGRGHRGAHALPGRRRLPGDLRAGAERRCGALAGFSLAAVSALASAAGPPVPAAFSAGARGCHLDDIATGLRAAHAAGDVDTVAMQPDDSA